MNYKMRIVISFVITLVSALLAYGAGAGWFQLQVIATLVVICFFVCVFLEKQLAIVTFLVALFAYLGGTGIKIAPMIFIMLGLLYVVAFVVKFLFDVLDFDDGSKPH